MDECPKCDRCGEAPATGYGSWVLCREHHPYGRDLDEAYKRGLREGVELAKAGAMPTGPDWLVALRADIDWTDVDAELERRLGGGG